MYSDYYRAYIHFPVLCIVYVGKAYASEQEERLRRNLFADNLRKIESHNYLFEMGLKSYKMGINQFSDMVCRFSESKFIDGRMS